ncbi:MAG: hypothetical protein K0S11_1035 [Gammaproteobacteria bacterium]|jgi:glycosyltransferase involved in cell wall biosynthesis|nr:hypothetical protein [Gammaproteobacteria bacterium]
MSAKLPFILHLSAIKSWGGGEQQLIYLYQELVKQQVPQLIVCRKDSALANYCKAHHIEAITYANLSSIDLGFSRQLTKLCKTHAIDIIHAHDAHTQTNALLARLLFKLKPPLVISRKVAFPIKKSWLSRYKYNSRHIRKIICISQAVYQTVSSCIRDSSKLVVVNDGVDLKRFSLKSPVSSLRNTLKLKPDHLLIGTLAALVTSKDLFTFIKVAQQVIQQGISATFLIMGEGPLRTELQNLVAELDLAEQVIFLGFRSDIAELLPQLDIFMLTSQQEGMGSSILEAMACQVPVVATRVGGIPEIVLDGKTGLLADTGDVNNLVKAVIQLLQNNDLRQSLIVNATQQVAEFSIQNMAAKTLAVYRSIITHH